MKRIFSCRAKACAWLTLAVAVCTSAAPPKKYPFPTALAYSKAELTKRFGVVTVEQDPDPAIHYKLIMPLQWGQVSGRRQLVTPAHPFELRSHFKSLAPPLAEAKVTIAYVPVRVDASAWLAHYLRGQQATVLQERHVAQPGGTIPDVLTTSGPAGHERIARWIVLEDRAKIGGAHLFMLQVSTAARDYTPDMANVFFVEISNFDLLHATAD